MTRVEIAGVGFSGSEVPEGGLIFSRLVDWDGLPDVRGSGDDIPDVDGSFSRVRVVRDSRAITVEGAIVADSVEEYFVAKRRLESLPAVAVMRADLGDGYWSRAVEVQHVDIPDARLGFETEFKIDLLAPDPYRYSETFVAGPSGIPQRDGGLLFPAAFPWDFGTFVFDKALVENTGDKPVLPVIRVTGSADAITVFGGARRVEFPAFEGELVIDCVQRRAFLNGTDVTVLLIRREWPEVPSGQIREFFFTADAPSAETVLTVEYRIGVW